MEDSSKKTVKNKFKSLIAFVENELKMLSKESNNPGNVVIARYKIYDAMQKVLKEMSDKNETSTDNVNHPKHYTSHPSGIECIDIARHYCFSIGNAIKYLWRAGLKKEQGKTDRQKEIEDLQKAVWYINDRIKELQNEHSIFKDPDFDIDKLRKDDSKQ